MMQTDVKASTKLAASGAFRDANGAVLGRCRVKAFFAAGTGSLIINDGPGGPQALNADITAGGYVLLPGEGILIETGPIGTLTGITSCTLIYG